MMTKAQARYWYFMALGVSQVGWERTASEQAFDKAWSLYQGSLDDGDPYVPCGRRAGKTMAGLDRMMAIAGMDPKPPSEILESGTEDLPREATQPLSKPSHPDEVAEDPGEREETLEETRERCGGVFHMDRERRAHVCSKCGAGHLYASAVSGGFRCTAPW